MKWAWQHHPHAAVRLLAHEADGNVVAVCRHFLASTIAISAGAVQALGHVGGGRVIVACLSRACHVEEVLLFK